MILAKITTTIRFSLNLDFQFSLEELTTLQSILQNQIERFGQYFFKEGSMVIPGGNFLDTSYFAVRIDPQFLNIPVKEYTKYLAD